MRLTWFHHASPSYQTPARRDDSALVCGGQSADQRARRHAQRPDVLRRLCWYTFVDISAALGAALLVNAALLVVAAATFHRAGAVVLTLQVNLHPCFGGVHDGIRSPAAHAVPPLVPSQLPLNAISTASTRVAPNIQPCTPQYRTRHDGAAALCL